MGEFAPGAAHALRARAWRRRAPETEAEGRVTCTAQDARR